MEKERPTFDILRNQWKSVVTRYLVPLPTFVFPITYVPTYNLSREKVSIRVVVELYTKLL